MPAEGTGRSAAPAEVVVVGAGYVGLTTAACLARLGHRVVCTDVDESRITGLQQGEMPIHEPGLAELVRAGVDAARLSFVCGSAGAAARADFVFLCVPTPSGPDGGTDRGYLEAAVAEIGPSLRPGAVVVNKSTAPAGTVQLLARVLGRADVSVASNPEFLRQGSAVHDFLNPDRLVVGAADVMVAERVAGLYAGIDAPVLVTDPASAEDRQVRGQRLPGDEAVVLELGRRAVRGGGRRCRRRAGGDGIRRADRPRLPAARAGMGRLVPSEGHAFAGRRGLSRGLRLRAAAKRGGSQRSAVRQDCGQGRMPGRAVRGPHRAARPGLQGWYRRPARLALPGDCQDAWSRPAQWSMPTIRWSAPARPPSRPVWP